MTLESNWNMTIFYVDGKPMKLLFHKHFAVVHVYDGLLYILFIKEIKDIILNSMIH
jgi:hypothetical protein